MDTGVFQKSIECICRLSSKERTQVWLVADEAKNLYVEKSVLGDVGQIYERIQQLESPYFPKVYEIRYLDNKTFVLEEYIEGNTLSMLLEEQMDEAMAKRVIEQLLDAVSELHGLNPPLLHRDIKPDNIVITPEQKCILVDVETAREYKEKDDSADTKALGTRGYAPPEQYGFQQTDPSCDVYALGITIRDIVIKSNMTGRDRAVLQKMIQKATRFDPGNRYPSAVEMKKAFLIGRHNAIVKWIGIGLVLLACLILPLCIKKQEQETPVSISTYDYHTIPDDYVYHSSEKDLQEESISIVYSKASLQGILIQDGCFDSGLKKVTMESFLPDGVTYKETVVLLDGEKVIAENGCVCFTADFLKELEEGYYIFHAFAKDGERLTCRLEIKAKDFYEPMLLVPVHAIDKSLENDVLISVFNTSIGITSVECNGDVLEPESYSLFLDGRGIVLKNSFLWEKALGERMTLAVTLSDGTRLERTVDIVQ